MRSFLGLAIGGVFLLSVSQSNADQSNTGTISPERAVYLMNLLKQDCGSCHGMTMKGGLGPPLLPKNLAGRDENEISEIILNGVPGQPMPPWNVELSTDEALWIVRNLMSGLDL